MPRKNLKKNYIDITQISIHEQSSFNKKNVKKTCLKCGKVFYRSENDNYHLCKQCREENMGRDDD
jgi:predicted RNA-binding Zn-ribbon protein involved in translation (DUF1610 family)